MTPQTPKPLNVKASLTFKNLKKVTPRSGLYRIYNKKNGKFYIGETGSLRQRLNGHYTSLELNTMTNRELNKDWFVYGKNAFVFEVLDDSDVLEDPILRKQLEKKLILTYSPFAYNIVNNPLVTPKTGKTGLSNKPIVITINGVTYPNKTVAAVAYGVTSRAIGYRLKQPRFIWGPPLLKDKLLQDAVLAYKKAQPSKSILKSRGDNWRQKVCIESRTFSSLEDASNFLQISRSTIHRRLRDSKYSKTYFYLDENNQPLEVKAINKKRKDSQNQNILFLSKKGPMIFNNLTEAASFLKVDKNTVSRRINSSILTNLFYLKTLNRFNNFVYLKKL